MMNRRYSPFTLALFAIFLLFFMRGMEAAWVDIAEGRAWLPSNWVVLGLQLIALILQVRAYNSMTRNGYRWEMVRKVHRVEELPENELVKDVLEDPGTAYFDEGTVDAVRDKQVSKPQYKYYQQ